ncbi:MAG TPA: hypothetical protein VEC16_02600 [Alphaproteobacteria bacterium]|nr:hypothetical protein [Alphaproteobacteria bacterium]
MSKNIDALSYVIRGKNRRDVLKTLGKHALLRQADVAKLAKMYRTHARRTLLELEDKKLIKCVNEKESQGKLYQITPSGKTILKELNEIYN